MRAATCRTGDLAKTTNLGFPGIRIYYFLIIEKMIYIFDLKRLSIEKDFINSQFMNSIKKIDRYNSYHDLDTKISII